LTSSPGARLALKENSLDTGLVTINYAEGSDNGPPLILLHGIGRNWRDFLRLLPAFDRWHVFALDLRGHGRSSHVSQGYCSGDYATDVIALLQHKIRVPAVIFGHSLGGVVAMHVAACLPERVRAIIIRDSALTRHTLVHSMYQALFTGLYQVVRRGGSPREMAHQLATLEIPVPGLPGTVPIGELPGNSEADLLKWADSLQQVDPDAMRATIEGYTLEDFHSDTSGEDPVPHAYFAGEPRAGAA
jgi:pimeloyl-ACP methyl ester carboxylesterase